MSDPKILVCGPGEKEWRGRSITDEGRYLIIVSNALLDYLESDLPLDDPKPDFIIGGDNL